MLLMKPETKPTSMRTFMIIWLGQMVSSIGSYMTNFALSLWAWEITGQATALALVGFFSQLPSLFIVPFAGVIIDRWNRKLLLMLCDAMAGFSSIAIFLLYVTGNLQIWHLYVTAGINGTFGQIQTLAYSASISLLVPKENYTRSSSLQSLLHYGSNIIAPALAGSLYYVIGLLGILVIDLTTFAIAITTMLLVRFPQRADSERKSSDQIQPSIWQEAIFGFRYIFKNSNLLAILVYFSLFSLAHDLGAAIYKPMIFARTANNAAVLGSILSAAGVGGVIGALILTTWGGPKRKINGMLAGIVGAGFCKIIFGLAQTPVVWISVQFFSSLNFPLMGCCNDAIWLNKVKPEIQGRVFATRSLVTLVTSAIAYLIAGVLADRIFEPIMMPGGILTPIFGWLFGTGKGAGIALLYTISSVCLLLLGLSGYVLPILRNAEITLKDDAPKSQLQKVGR